MNTQELDGSSAFAAQRQPEIAARREWTSALVGEDHHRLRKAGRRCARALEVVDAPSLLSMTGLDELGRDAFESIEADAAGLSKTDTASRCLIENVWFLRQAQKQIRDLDVNLRPLPYVNENGAAWPRALVVARAYLRAADYRFGEESLVGFVNGFQDVTDLRMAEIESLKALLQLVLLQKIQSIATSGDETIIAAVSSIRHIVESDWRGIFARASVVDVELARDPAGAYRLMESESKDDYRYVVATLAKRSKLSEREIARTAVELAAKGAKPGADDRAARRRAHVGYYLVDRGLRDLRRAVGYRPTMVDQLRNATLRRPAWSYLAAIALFTALPVATLLAAFGLSAWTPLAVAVALLVLPASQAAVDFVNNLMCSFIPPRSLPKMDFSKGVPERHTTLVAVPTLLLNEMQVLKLVSDLEIRYLANSDRNIYFALVTDWPDADKAVDESRDHLVNVCRELIEDLNRRYGTDDHTPFYLFHRHRVYNANEGRWMGWERKRGKIIDLNQMLRGAWDSFPVKVGNTSIFKKIRYVITLDSDTQLPPGVAQRLIGAMAHPLNQAVVNPRTKMVDEGYGIIQPRIGISVHSATRSRLARLFSGHTGLDLYTRAVSDLYQDLFGEGIFTGKGIYEVDTFRETLEQRFPENALLSHDLIEGAYARAGLATDIELIDDYPSHFSAYSRRKHRWVRGDWQIMRWLWPRVKDFKNNTIVNPISTISRWKILDNLRRSMVEPALLTLFLGGWFFLPGPALLWTLVALAMAPAQAYWGLMFSIVRAPWGESAMRRWARETAKGFVREHAMALLQIVFLPHQAMLSADAIIRSLARVFVTKKKLLEWETAAESEAARRRASVDRYLAWTPILSVLTAAVLAWLRPETLYAAGPVLALWTFSGLIARWLNASPRTAQKAWTGENSEMLESVAEKTWRFYADWSNEEMNHLVPDNVREDGGADSRLSPTNVGFLLNARIAAVHLRHLSVEEFATQSLATLRSVDKLPKYRGHLFNWYDAKTMQPLEPRFVSTVDSGNLVAALWTLKQAATAFARESKDQPVLRSRLAAVAALSDRLIRATDFRFLYQRRRKALSIGFNATTNTLELSCYDLLASEARLAVFVAIAKGDVPQEAWFHLGRKHTLAGGERLLVSWSGTMFEYLMPALWMRHSPHTTMKDSMEAAVRTHIAYGKQKGIPWGISESACPSKNAEDEYGYWAFGLPSLALKNTESDPLVVSPYSSFLALFASPRAAIRNLRQMQRDGWTGRYGFYEAADMSGGDPALVKIWMAHHQGMILLSLANLLCDHPIQKYFHAEPHVMAAELLLHERVPRAA